MNKPLYLISGIAFLALGIYITIKQIETFRRRKQDQLGFDIKLLGGGIVAIILGLGMISEAF